MNILNNDFLFENDHFEDEFPRIPRRIYVRAEYFNSFEDLIFFQRFRITKPTALAILDQIDHALEFPYDMNKSVAPINQLLIFLRFCATGTHLSCIADFGGVHLSTVSRVVVRVGTALARLYNQYIKMPRTEEEINQSQLGFYEKSRFPRVIGALDCTHIKIQSPGGEDGEVYRNRKGYFSINVQAIGSSSLKFVNVVARWPGSTHDSTIFNNSRIKNDFENNLFPNSLLLGDAGYNLRPYLITPLPDPITRTERLFNESQIRTRNIIERIFGIWKRRFPVLAYGCRLKIETILILIVATAVIHNICRANNEEDPPEPEDVQRFIQVMQEDQVPNIPGVNNHVAPIAEQVRRDLIENYFQYIDE